ncbi:hypothetical protein BGX38DRAFT_1201578, partial [Terfezia claveryi]
MLWWISVSANELFAFPFRHTQEVISLFPLHPISVIFIAHRARVSLSFLSPSWSYFFFFCH